MAVTRKDSPKTHDRRPVRIQVELVRSDGQDTAILDAIKACQTKILRQLGEMKAQIDSLLAKGDQMATKQDFDTLRTDVNDSTNAIAARIDALIAKLAAGGMSAAEEDAVLAEFGVMSGALKALGADPADPVPPLPEEPPA